MVWSDARQKFAFTCDECGEHSDRAISVQGLIEVRIVKPPRSDT